MAKMYTSIDSYVQSVGSKYIDKGEFGGEGGRIGSDSAMRNYIAEQIQRLEDNGRDISGMQGFYDQVGARSVDGFANAGLFAETDKIGGRELTSIAATMMRLDEMQADGRISMDEYEGYLNEMLSPDGVSAIAASGNDKIFSLFEDIERDSEREPDPGVAKENASELAIGTRTYVNDRDDYLNDAREQRSGDEAYNAARSAEDYDVFSDMDDKIREAHEAGFLTESQYEDARSGLRSFQTSGYTNYMAVDTMLFAMEDALASGQPDLVSKIMSKDGIEGITQNTPDGVNMLRDVAYWNARPSDAAPSAQDPTVTPVEPVQTITLPEQGPTVHPGIIAQPDNTIDIAIPMPVDIRAQELVTIMDTMGQNYFEQSEKDGGISLEEYSSMAEAYDAMKSDPQKQAYLTLHPDFAEAHNYMSKLDQLEQGVMSGEMYINSVTDENGNTTYSIGYPDDVLTAEQIVMYDSKPDLSMLVDRSFGDIGNTLAGGAIGGMNGLMMSDQTRATMAFGPDFLNDLNYAVNKTKDPDYTPPDPTVHHGDVMPVDPGVIIHAPLDGIREKINLLTDPSPEERLRELQGVANDIWSGKLGNGEDRRNALIDMGYDDDARKMIADMVNQGQEWCENAGATDFDQLFPDPDGVSLVDREAAFQADRLSVAETVMTYESPDAFMKVYNDDLYYGVSAEQAAELYERAGQVTSSEQLYDEGGLLQSVAEQSDAGFNTPEMPVEESAPAPEPTQAPKEIDNSGFELS